MLYKVLFNFVNDLGETRRDFLSNNGRGFNRADAEDLAQELRFRDLDAVEIVELSADEIRAAAFDLLREDMELCQECTEEEMRHAVETEDLFHLIAYIESF